MYKSFNLLYKIQGTRPNLLSPCLNLVRFYYYDLNQSENARNSHLPKGKLGIFWDLDCKPPRHKPAVETANKLRLAVASFGMIRYMISYADRHADVCYNEGRMLKFLENKGVIKKNTPNVCRFCGRKFYTNAKLVSHFDIHVREHRKRLARIESAKGKRRAILVGKHAFQLERFKRASRDVLNTEVVGGLDEALEKAGYWVKVVSDNMAVEALKNHMMSMMDRGLIQCLVLVSKKKIFLGVLKEARKKCVKTVVVGSPRSSVLRGMADASFSWRDVVSGKARTQSDSVVGRWKDRDILKELEWRYNPKLEKEADKLSYSKDEECGVSSAEDRDIIVWEAKTQQGSIVGRGKDHDILKILDSSYDPQVDKEANELSGSRYFKDKECRNSTTEDDDCLFAKDNKPWWELD